MSAPNLVAVFVENKPGQTARITKILADGGINIRWVTIANSGSFGVMKFLVDRCDEAVMSLRENGLMVSLLEVLAVEVTMLASAFAHAIRPRRARTAVSFFISPFPLRWRCTPGSPPGC